MSVAEDGKTWRKGVATVNGKPSGIIAIANNDQLDDDVRNAGTLVGLSCSGQYTYATPYFAHTKPNAADGEDTQYSYTAGTLLTFCADDEVDDYDYVENGELKHSKDEGIQRSLKGFIRPANKGELVIGVVSQTGYGPYNINPVTKVDDPDAAGRGYIVEGLNRNAIPFSKAVGADPAYRMPEGVWALQSSIGTAVDSTSKINNAYLVVFDTMHTGVYDTGTVEA